MSKILCYSVKLKNLVSISEKAYLATSFDGSKEIIPKSQIFLYNNEIKKSDAYWISAWILEKKNLQFSRKKMAWFDKKTGKIMPHIEYKHHIPNKLDSSKIEHEKNLFK